MQTIAITTSSFGTYDTTILSMLRKKNLRIVTNPYGRTLTPEELLQVAGKAVGIIAGTEKIAQDTLTKLPLLKVISRCGTGMDSIDLVCAKELGIKVFNTPDAPTEAVAELTVGLMLNLLRKISEMDHELKNRRWKKIMGNLLASQKVGIIGYGRIGRRVAKLLRPFGVALAYTDPFVAVRTKHIKKLPLTKLLSWADIICIHASSKTTILSPELLRKMKKGAWLINVSRGKSVDENALYDLLQRGYLAGAAIDVFEQEPYQGKLATLHNVVVTPHIGTYAKESRAQMEHEAALNLIQGLEELT